MQTSNFLRLDLRDIGRGLLMTILGAIVSAAYSAVQSSITTHHLVLNWNVIGIAAISSGLAYLKLQLFTAGAVVTPKETPQS